MKEKNITLSIIRVIATIMIIFCHILQGLGSSWAYWANLGVTIFFFLSGYLYGNKKIEDIKSFYQSRFFKILLPNIIVIFLAVLIEYLCFRTRPSIMVFIASILGFGGFYQLPPVVTHTWFVSYIALCYLLLPFFQYYFSENNFKNNLKKLFILIIVLQLFQEFHVLWIESAWIINFLLGYFFVHCCKREEDKKTCVLLLIVGTCFFTPFTIIYQEQIQTSLPRILNDHSTLWIQYGHVMLGCFLFMILYYGLNHFKLKYNKVLTFIDTNSYYIYLVHQIFILYTFSLLEITNNLWINIGLIIICILIGSILLKWIHEKVMKLIEVIK